MTKCWACSPYCGKCKPPKQMPQLCDSCRTLNFPDRGEVGVCKTCGAKLPEVKPRPVVRCLTSGLVCANPCGNSKVRRPDGTTPGCKLNTAPSANQMAGFLEAEGAATQPLGGEQS